MDEHTKLESKLIKNKPRCNKLDFKWLILFTWSLVFGTEFYTKGHFFYYVTEGTLCGLGPRAPRIAIYFILFFIFY